jgi:DNA-binding response OmpR family regulator
LSTFTAPTGRPPWQLTRTSTFVSSESNFTREPSREFSLLHYLAARAGQVVSKRELLSEVWQLPYGGADKTVDVHLSWLRRKPA